mmetsp:Transcript_114339/g.296074  ORF Transcript_114339/g.296074 Transcript_114339/m.296074 type:complete len:82 (-) Transcript_114339:540-785(-)
MKATLQCPAFTRGPHRHILAVKGFAVLLTTSAVSTSSAAPAAPASLMVAAVANFHLLQMPQLRFAHVILKRIALRHLRQRC